jgi:hypothetical protein
MPTFINRKHVCDNGDTTSACFTTSFAMNLHALTSATRVVGERAVSTYHVLAVHTVLFQRSTNLLTLCWAEDRFLLQQTRLGTYLYSCR